MFTLNPLQFYGSIFGAMIGVVWFRWRCVAPNSTMPKIDTIGRAIRLVLLLAILVVSCGTLGFVFGTLATPICAAIWSFVLWDIEMLMAAPTNPTAAIWVFGELLIGMVFGNWLWECLL